MHSSPAAPARQSVVSQALARDRVGVPSVWSFLMSGIAPLTVAAGVITSAYATTGLTGIPFAFVAVAVVLALFVPAYVAMSRYITNAGACYKAHMFAATCARQQLMMHGFGSLATGWGWSGGSGPSRCCGGLEVVPDGAGEACLGVVIDVEYAVF
jgi:hypothetical protein